MNILSLAPLDGDGLVALRSLGTVEVDPWSAHVPIKLHSAPELIERLAGVDMLIVEADFIPRDVFEATSLRFLGVCRGDPNNVDVAAATAAGVPVIRTPGRNAGGVADLAIGSMYCLLRSIVAADADVRAGRWVVDGRLTQQRYLGRELASCTVGLVGFGAVGRAVAHRLKALGARVVATDPVADPDELRGFGVEWFEDLGDLIEASDIVSVHAPLTPATRGLIGGAALARARQGTYLVNTARYGIVDEAAMLAALADGRLAGAALDHFEGEFLAADHPLLSMSNVVLTPHIGGSTIETIHEHTRQIADAVQALLAGISHDAVVNPEAVQARA